MDNPTPPAKPQAHPPAQKLDPTTILAMQLEQLKKIADHLNFIKSAIIIGVILYIIDTLILLFNRFVSSIR